MGQTNFYVTCYFIRNMFHWCLYLNSQPIWAYREYIHPLYVHHEGNFWPFVALLICWSLVWMPSRFCHSLLIIPWFMVVKAAIKLSLNINVTIRHNNQFSLVLTEPIFNLHNENEVTLTLFTTTSVILLTFELTKIPLIMIMGFFNKSCLWFTVQMFQGLRIGKRILGAFSQVGQQHIILTVVIENPYTYSASTFSCYIIYHI